jgi:hypothetical protein
VEKLLDPQWLLIGGVGVAVIALLVTLFRVDQGNLIGSLQCLNQRLKPGVIPCVLNRSSMSIHINLR